MLLSCLACRIGPPSLHRCHPCEHAGLLLAPTLEAFTDADGPAPLTGQLLGSWQPHRSVLCAPGPGSATPAAGWACARDDRGLRQRNHTTVRATPATMTAAITNGDTARRVAPRPRAAHPSALGAPPIRVPMAIHRRRSGVSPAARLSATKGPGTRRS